MKEGVVQAIEALAVKASNPLPPIEREVHGKKYVYVPDGKGSFKVEERGGPGLVPGAILLHTLTGLVGYLKPTMALPAVAGQTATNAPIARDGVEPDQVLVHVIDHEHVAVRSALDAEHYAFRDVYAKAEFKPLIGDPAIPFAFGKFLDLETFNVGLQALFEENPDRSRVLLVSGTVSSSKVTTALDDGVTQRVEARAGTVGIYEKDIPNPVTLRPFRTFREVEQPESLFVLRFSRAAEGELPKAALFEADGGKWKLEAIQRIADYLRSNLPDTVTVLA